MKTKLIRTEKIYEVACPFCGWTIEDYKDECEMRSEIHLAECYDNPDNRTCGTCKHNIDDICDITGMDVPEHWECKAWKAKESHVVRKELERK